VARLRKNRKKGYRCTLQGIKEPCFPAEEWMVGDGDGEQELAIGPLSSCDCWHNCEQIGANGVTMENTGTGNDGIKTYSMLYAFVKTLLIASASLT